MPAKVVPDARAMRRFHDAVVQLSRMKGQDFEKVIKAELGAALTRAQKETLKADVAKIKRHTQNQQYARIDLGDGKKLYFLGNKFGPDKWRRVEQYLDNKEAKRIKARGLAARMWWHIAQALGLPMKSPPAYVRNATSWGKDMREAVQTYQSGSGNKYRIGFINSLTGSNIGARAGAAFNIALTARANLFSRAMKDRAKGVIRNVLDRYPGLGRVS